MKITYLDHSGFAVDLGDKLLIFDYYRGELPAGTSDRKLYVFSSHAHQDHFQKKIFAWSGDRDVTYILSKDIRKNAAAKNAPGEGVYYLAPRQELPLDGLSVRTLRSTDAGVAFLVETEGKVIYHAGDLNWWHWEEEDDAYNRMMRGDYQKEIETLTGEKIDLAFVVLDPRQEEQFYWGFDWYMRHTDTKIVFPMHMWKQYEVQDRLIGMEVSEPYREKIMRIREMGQVFEL